MRLLLALLVLTAAALPPRPAGAQDAPPPTRAQIERIVREYLVQNPEVILEAMEAYEARRRSAAEAGQRAALAARRADIFAAPDDPVAGNPDGDVTIVEFFDYRCPYCKQVAGPLMQLLQDDRQVRFVFKELPILAPDSVEAARAALAAKAQGKYAAMHAALMKIRGGYDEAAILKAAAEAGVDARRLKADMDAPSIAAALERNRQLAQELAISGTPGFVVGATAGGPARVVPGAVDLATLKTLVAEARGR